MSNQDSYLPQLLQALQGATPEQAVELLTEAAASYPNDARPLLLLGAELMQAGKPDGAEAAYTVALQRAPEFWIARFQLGLLQFTSARPAIAMVTWAPLDGLEPTHPLRLFKQAFECLAQDDFEQARDLLRRGIAANTDNPPLNRDMEMLLEKLAQQGLTGTPAQPGEPAPANAADEHVFVSAYRNLH